MVGGNGFRTGIAESAITFALNSGVEAEVSLLSGTDASAGIHRLTKSFLVFSGITSAVVNRE